MLVHVWLLCIYFNKYFPFTWSVIIIYSFFDFSLLPYLFMFLTLQLQKDLFSFVWKTNKQNKKVVYLQQKPLDFCQNYAFAKYLIFLLKNVFFLITIIWEFWTESFVNTKFTVLQLKVVIFSQKFEILQKLIFYYRKCKCQVKKQVLQTFMLLQQKMLQ